MGNYNLLPTIKDIQIGDKITKSQITQFWNLLIVHYELSHGKYAFENIEQMIVFNPRSVVNQLNIILRYVSLARINYLAAQLNKELPKQLVDSEQFKLISNQDVWTLAYEQYKLPKKEYDYASQVVAMLKQEIPKSEVDNQFKKIVQLIIILIRNIKKYEQSTMEITTASKTVVLNEEQKKDVTNEVSATVMEVKKHTKVKNTVQLEVNQTKGIGNFETTKSSFLRQLKILQKSSKESVVHAEEFGPFQNYMHIARPIEQETIEKLEFIKTCVTPQVLFICGSVGDGKSHLLAYLKRHRKELLEDFYIHNDATESYIRTKSAEETLEEILKPFDDGATPTQHMIIAINIGKLHNFYNRQKKSGRFQGLCQFIDSLKIFETESELAADNTMDCFHAVDFSKVKYYRIDETGVSSPFYLEALEKITAPHVDNEIYQAWKLDIENGIHTIVHDNYKMLMEPQVQKRVVEKLIQTIIRNKIIVSTRSYYNFVFDIIVPSSLLINTNLTGFAIQNTLPNLLFESLDRSDVLLSMNEIEPLNNKGMQEDEIITNIFIHTDVFTYIKQHLNIGEMFMFEDIVKVAIAKGAYKELAKYMIRMKAVLENEPLDTIYSKFIRYIYSYYRGEAEPLEELFEIIEQVLFKWKGSPRDNYIYVSSEAQKDYRLAVPVKLEPVVDESVFESMTTGVIEASEDFLTIGFNEHLFELDLRLFEFLLLVKKGYCPNLTEINEAIQFEEFYNKIVREAEEKENLFLLVHLQTNTHFEVAKSKSKFTKNKYEVRKV